MKTLLGCGLEVARVGLGSDRLHRLGHIRYVAPLVRSAIDVGVTHFDTAPFYGDSRAEILLGASLNSRRSDVTIATKFGLLPNRLIGNMGPLGLPLRAVRAALRKSKLIRFPKCSAVPRDLHESIAASLRSLRTDYVDIFFLHEPEMCGVSDELIDAIRQAKQKGQARYIGAAGQICERTLTLYGDYLDVIQAPFNDETASHSNIEPDILYGAVSSKVDATRPTERALSYREALQIALANRPQSCVLIGTTKAKHLAEMVCQ